MSTLQKSIKYFLIYLPFVPLAMFLTFYGGSVVEKSYGYHVHLLYNNCGVYCDSTARALPQNQKGILEKKYSSEIEEGINFPEKEKYLYLKSYVNKEHIMLGTGWLILLLGLASLGCVVTFSRLGVLLRVQPFFIMLASMWAFEPIRSLYYIYYKDDIIKPENIISEGFNLPSYFLIVLLSIIGLIISFFILRKIYLAGELKSFLIGSFLGAPVGMFLWLKVIGPLILP